MGSKITQLLNRKWLRQLVFFIGIAFIFLLLTKLSKEYTRDLLVSLVPQNVPKENIIVKHNNIIRAKVKSTGYNFLPFLFRDYSITVDVEKDLKDLNNNYIWTLERGGYQIEELLGDNYEILSVWPDSLLFEYQKMATKKVHIRLNGEMTFAPGYNSMDMARTEPDSLMLIGPQKSINNIEYVNTETFKFEDLKKPISVDLKISKDNLEDNIQLSEDQIKLNVDVNKFTEGTFNIPVEVINVPSEVSLNFFPKTLPVTYYVSLSNYKSIKEEDFKVQCDYATIEDNNSNVLTGALTKIPDLVKTAKLKQNKINIIIE